MALMDQQSNNPYDQTINKNQYLTGDPNTQNNANTVWMNPSQGSNTTGINGGGGFNNVAQQQPNPPSQVSNGTMLGSIAAGNVSQQAPPGFDQSKWNDPNKHDPKYDVGRILSKYPSSTEGLQAAMQELGPLGYRMSGKDSIIGPDGIPIDVGFAFGSGQGSHWQWNPNDPNSMNQSASGSMLGNQTGNQNQMQNMIWQAIQAQRSNAMNQQFNPSGGQLQFPMGQSGPNQLSLSSAGDPSSAGDFIPTAQRQPYSPPTGGISGYANNGPVTPPMFANQPQFSSMLGLNLGNNYDPRVMTQYGVAQ
jgi:hypothetical protein